jgi:uncharacterized pyridoxamine 5'-phosphate oxidase family protein
MQEVLDFLTKAGVWYLATDDNGQPRVRPFGAQNIFEGKLYIQTGLKKNVAQQMLKNPKIELCAFSEGKWLRVAAEAVLDERIEAQEAMLNANPALKQMYAAGDGNTAVFYLKNATATFSSFTEEPRTVQF